MKELQQNLITHLKKHLILTAIILMTLVLLIPLATQAKTVSKGHKTTTIQLKKKSRKNSTTIRKKSKKKSKNSRKKSKKRSRQNSNTFQTHKTIRI